MRGKIGGILTTVSNGLTLNTFVHSYAQDMIISTTSREWIFKKFSLSILYVNTFYYYKKYQVYDLLSKNELRICEISIIPACTHS